MRAPEAHVVAEKKHSGAGVVQHSFGRIKVKWLPEQTRISRPVTRVCRCACERERARKHSCQQPTRLHFDTTPTSPPEISDATFVRILGSTNPPGEARYLGSHTGENF